VTKRYSAAGIPQIEYDPTTTELVHGATWVRGDNPISVPVQDADFYVARNFELVGIIILTDAAAAGSCVVDIWKDVFANFPPTVFDTIFASGKPTISGGFTYSDFILAGVTTAFAAGDTLRFHLQSSSLFKHITVWLLLRRV
jgi:hypothetical protein